MKKILIFKTRLPAFEPVDASCRKWLKGAKYAVGVDKSIVKYINYTYKGQVKVDYKDPFKANLEEYDKIFIGMEYWSLAHILKESGQRGLKAYKKLIETVKDKLYTPYPFVEMSYDKCRMHKEMVKIGIPVAPTFCINLKETTPEKAFQQIKRKKWGRVFLKPIPGEESMNTFDSGDEFRFPDFKRYMSKLKQYDHLVCQKFMPSFATDKHPEIRTFWVNKKYAIGVKTTSVGYFQDVVTRLPAQVRNGTKQIIQHLEKTFQFPFVAARFDWGVHEGKYFFNEMELVPGFFNDGIDDHTKCRWNLDALIGDRLVELLYV